MIFGVIDHCAYHRVIGEVITNGIVVIHDGIVKESKHYCCFNTPRQIAFVAQFKSFPHFNGGKYVLLYKAWWHD